MEIDILEGDERCVIRMAGRFDTYCRREFLDAVEKVFAGNAHEIRIDFGSVDYLDSTALGVLLLMREKAKSEGKKAILVNAHGSVMRVLEGWKFNKLFRMAVDGTS